MKRLDHLTGRGLYVITAGAQPDLLEVAAQAFAGGARMLQYRDTSTDHERRLAEAAALKQLCAAHAAPLIIDHDVSLAKAVEADGVHVGKEDDDLATVRAVLCENAIIGVSCYDSFERAKRFADAGASYVSFGAFFASPTKPMAKPISIEVLRQSAALGIPRVAIGGITPDNGASLVDAGADYLAVISAIFSADDVQATARQFAALYSHASGTTA